MVDGNSSDESYDAEGSGGSLSSTGSNSFARDAGVEDVPCVVPDPVAHEVVAAVPAVLAIVVVGKVGDMSARVAATPTLSAKNQPTSNIANTVTGTAQPYP